MVSMHLQLGRSGYQNSKQPLIRTSQGATVQTLNWVTALLASQNKAAVEIIFFRHWLIQLLYVRGSAHRLGSTRGTTDKSLTTYLVILRSQRRGLAVCIMATLELWLKILGRFKSDLLWTISFANCTLCNSLCLASLEPILILLFNKDS